MTRSARVWQWGSLLSWHWYCLPSCSLSSHKPSRWLERRYWKRKRQIVNSIGLVGTSGGRPHRTWAYGRSDMTRALRRKSCTARHRVRTGGMLIGKTRWRLREQAEAISRTVPDTARLVIAGVIRFDW